MGVSFPAASKNKITGSASSLVSLIAVSSKKITGKTVRDHLRKLAHVTFVRLL